MKSACPCEYPQRTDSAALRCGGVPWQRMTEPSKEDVASTRQLRRAKLYADEDVEDFMVEIIRSVGVNITSARELPGHRGKPDEWHAAYAKRERRFLLTKNARDFMDDRKLPWENTYGVIAIDGDFGDVDQYVASVRHVVQLVVPLGELFVKTKIHARREVVSVKGRTRDGRVETSRLRIAGDYVEEWVNPPTRR